MSALKRFYLLLWSIVMVGHVTVGFAEVLPTVTTVEVSQIDNLDKKISLDFVDADLKDILKIFTRQTGVNFVIDSEVTSENISLFLEKVTVRQALKSIANVNGLGFYPIEGTTILRVGMTEEGEKDLRITKIYRLSYARVKRLRLSSGEQIQQAGALGDGVDEVEDEGDNIFTTGDSESPQGVVNAVVSILSEDGILSLDYRTNSIIVTDYPDRIKRIDRVIEELDEKTQQVLIKAEIIELTNSFNDVLGATFGNANNAQQLFSLKYRPPIVDGQVFPFNKKILGTINKKLTYADGATAKTDGTVFGKLTGGQFDFIFKALKKSGMSKFLARPRIITLNNEPAIVNITSETAISENTIVDDDTNQQRTTVQRTPVGVTLRVTPQINDNHFVTMVLQPSVTDVSPSTLFPTRAFDPSTRSVYTKIRIKEGDTISIAGLLQKDKSRSGTKVPILGEIPIIGALFSSKLKEGKSTDLVIFITPYILNDDSMLFLQKRAEDEEDYGELVKESKRMDRFVKGKYSSEAVAEREKHQMAEVSLTDKLMRYEAKVREYPSDPEAHSNLGVAYAKAQKYDMAIEEFKKAIMLNPNSGAAYNNLGNLYRIKKQYNAAISSLRRAIELVPDHPYAYTTLGLCYEMKDMYDDARQSYRKALQTAPDSSWSSTARDRLSVLDASF